MKIIFLLLLGPWLTLAAAQDFFTGFNYGAFWSEQSNPNQTADFADGFTLARTLNTSVPFDSARLFTCIATGTAKDPTGAFDAAVETGTYLLLGFWISGGENGSPTALVSREMEALEKGFQKHGQALADLVIGLSVGNEDIYRFSIEEAGVEAPVVATTIGKVKELVAKSGFAAYMEDVPIGHVDTAPYAVVDGADFAGMTAYPYWNKESIEEAKKSFFSSLDEVKKRAGNVPVWIAEMGWPFEGTQQGAAVASLENMQKYWTEVGCEVFGKYNTFWFELLRDSTSDQPDWALMDSTTRQPRVKNLMCPGSSPAPSTETPTSPLSASVTVKTSELSENGPMASTSKTGASDFMYPTPTSIISASNSPIPAPVPTSVSKSAIASSSLPDNVRGSSTVVITRTITVHPSTTPQAQTMCVTVADISHNNVFATLASGPPGPDGKCAPAPDFTGYPYVTVTAHVPLSTPLPTANSSESSSTASLKPSSTTNPPSVTISEAPSTLAAATPTSQQSMLSTTNTVSSSTSTSATLQSSGVQSTVVKSSAAPISATVQVTPTSSSPPPADPPASPPSGSKAESALPAQNTSGSSFHSSAQIPTGSPPQGSPSVPAASSQGAHTRSNPGGAPPSQSQKSPSTSPPGVTYTVTSDSFPSTPTTSIRSQSHHPAGPPPRTPAPPESFDAPAYTGTKDVNPEIQSQEISLAHHPAPATVSKSLPSGRYDPGTMHNPTNSRGPPQVQTERPPLPPVKRDVNDKLMMESMTKVVRRDGGDGKRQAHILPSQTPHESRTSERENAEFKLRAEKNGAGAGMGQSLWLQGLVGLAWA